MYASRLHILSAARFRLLALAFCVLAQAVCAGQVARTPPPPGQSVRFVPNLCNDAHDCPLSTADTWLKTRIDPLIHSPQFQIDGLLIIVFDEANTLDFTSGGGHVAAVIASPLAKRGYKSIAFYQHQSVLRLTLEGLGVTQLPGKAPQHQPCGSFLIRRRTAPRLGFS